MEGIGANCRQFGLILKQFTLSSPYVDANCLQLS